MFADIAGLVRAARALFFFLLREALAAIYRTVFPWAERHFRFAAAVGAGGGEHLTVGPGCALSRIAAGLAALRLIYKTALSVKFLLAGRENKIRSTVFALERFVFVHCFNLA